MKKLSSSKSVLRVLRAVLVVAVLALVGGAVLVQAQDNVLPTDGPARSGSGVSEQGALSLDGTQALDKFVFTRVISCPSTAAYCSPTTFRYDMGTISPGTEAVKFVKAAPNFCKVKSASRVVCNVPRINGGEKRTETFTVSYTPATDYFTVDVLRNGSPYSSATYLLDPFLVGVESLVNDGFEVANVSNETLPDSWTGQKLEAGADIRQCETALNTKSVEGTCEFRFKGQGGKRAGDNLKQTISVLPAGSADSGDWLWIEAFVTANNGKSGAGLKVTVTNANGKKKTYTLPFKTGTYAYGRYFRYFVLSGNGASAVAQLYYKGELGSYTVDDVSVVFIDND